MKKYFILQDLYGIYEQGFYGVFFKTNKTIYLVEIFQFRKDAEEFLKAFKRQF